MSGPVQEAYGFARQAEDFSSAGQIPEAIDAHYRAAELFLAAVNSVPDAESGRALKLLYQHHSKKAKDLRTQIRDTDTSAENDHPSGSTTNITNNDGQHIISSHISHTVSTSVGPDGDYGGKVPDDMLTSNALLKGPYIDRHISTGKAPVQRSQMSGASSGSDGFMDMKKPVKYHQEYEEPSSPELPWFRYITEKLEALVNVVQKGASSLTSGIGSRQGDTRKATISEGTGTDSFIVIPEKRASAATTTTDEAESLRRVVNRLLDENAELKKGLKSVIERAKQEKNDIASSVMMFKSEIMQKMNQEQSRRLGQSTFVRPATRVSPEAPLQLKFDELKRQLELEKEKNNRLVKIINRYEMRWSSIKDAARKKRDRIGSADSDLDKSSAENGVSIRSSVNVNASANFLIDNVTPKSPQYTDYGAFSSVQEEEKAVKSSRDKEADSVTLREGGTSAVSSPSLYFSATQEVLLSQMEEEERREREKESNE